jgi:hypothetical protein
LAWKNIPPSQLYCKEPRIEQCQVQVCQKESGLKVLTDIETCLPLGSEFTLKTPVLCSGEIQIVPEIQCELVTFYKVTLPEAGTVEQQWVANSTAQISTGDSYKTLAFTGTDQYGLPQHAVPTADATVSNNFSQTTNIANPGEQDQSQSDFYIFQDEEFELGALAGFADASGIWIGCDINNMTEIQDGLWPNIGAASFGMYEPKIYRVRLYADDEGTSGATRLSVNGSLATAYPTKPKVEVVKEWICTNQNVQEYAEENGLLCEDPRCEPAPSCDGCSEIIIVE